VSSTFGITLAAESRVCFTFGLSSRALSTLSLTIFPTALATIGIASVTLAAGSCYISFLASFDFWSIFVDTYLVEVSDF
jgi:hypothetical protein